MKRGFAPAAILVLLLMVAGLGLAVTRTTDLKNVFQKPKAAGLDLGVNKGCSVTLSQSTINVGQGVTVDLKGEDHTTNIVKDNLTLVVSRADQGSVSGYGLPIYTDSQGHKYYSVPNSGLCVGGSSDFSCSLKTNISNLEVGTYKIWCGLHKDPSKCSGNPFCAYKGANPGVTGCDGWTSCGSSDHVDLTVTAPSTAAKSCTISAVVSGQTATVTSSGTGGTVRSFLSRTDSGSVNLGLPTFIDSAGHRYYEITYNVPNTPIGIPGLSEGNYKFWCTIFDEPNKCSGNPFCAYKGVNPGVAGCDGWVACSNSDNVSLAVSPPVTVNSCTFPCECVERDCSEVGIIGGERCKMSQDCIDRCGSLHSPVSCKGTSGCDTKSSCTGLGVRGPVRGNDAAETTYSGER